MQRGLKRTHPVRRTARHPQAAPRPQGQSPRPRPASGPGPHRARLCQHRTGKAPRAAQRVGQQSRVLADAGAVQQPALHTTAGAARPARQSQTRAGKSSCSVRSSTRRFSVRRSVSWLTTASRPAQPPTPARSARLAGTPRPAPRQAGVLGPGVGAASAQRAALQVHVRHVQQLCAAAARLPPERRAHAAGRLRSNDAAAAHADGKQTPPG